MPELGRLGWYGLPRGGPGVVVSCRVLSMCCLAFDGGCLFCAAMEAHDGCDKEARVMF